MDPQLGNITVWSWRLALENIANTDALYHDVDHTVLATLAGQAIPFALPASYYDTKTFERTGLVYERLGLPLFKKLVRRGPLAIFSPTLRFPKDRTVAALQHLDYEMRKAEAGHVYIFLLMLVFVSYALLNGWLDAVVWMLAFNILINGYPIMLQRYNRILLQELIQRQRVLTGQ